MSERTNQDDVPSDEGKEARDPRPMANDGRQEGPENAQQASENKENGAEAARTSQKQETPRSSNVRIRKLSDGASKFHEELRAIRRAHAQRYEKAKSQQPPQVVQSTEEEVDLEVRQHTLKKSHSSVREKLKELRIKWQKEDKEEQEREAHRSNMYRPPPVGTQDWFQRAWQTARDERRAQYQADVAQEATNERQRLLGELETQLSQAKYNYIAEQMALLRKTDQEKTEKDEIERYAVLFDEAIPLLNIEARRNRAAEREREEEALRDQQRFEREQEKKWQLMEEQRQRRIEAAQWSAERKARALRRPQARASRAKIIEPTFEFENQQQQSWTGSTERLGEDPPALPSVISPMEAKTFNKITKREEAPIPRMPQFAVPGSQVDSGMAIEGQHGESGEQENRAEEVDTREETRYDEARALSPIRETREEATYNEVRALSPTRKENTRSTHSQPTEREEPEKNPNRSQRIERVIQLQRKTDYQFRDAKVKEAERRVAMGRGARSWSPRPEDNEIIRQLKEERDKYA